MKLIKDSRFVLVGRGMYALSEWGYKAGIAREVIEDILKREGALSKEDVVEKSDERKILQKNTILVNLANRNISRKNKNWIVRFWLKNSPHPFTPLLDKERGWGEVLLCIFFFICIKIHIWLKLEPKKHSR